MKILYAYYSFEGNCRALVQAMADGTAGDIAEIRPVAETPRGTVMKYVQGGRASLMQESPAIEPLNVDMSLYDLIIVGGPVWAFNMAPPVRTFLRGTDWSDRHAALFVMHRGGAGNALRNMRRLIEEGGGEIAGSAEFLDLRRRNAAETRAAAVAWAAEAAGTAKDQEDREGSSIQENHGEKTMTQRIQAKATVQVETEFSRATEWRFAPGTETGYHKHAYNYVVVPMTDGLLLLETPDGEKHRTLEAGKAYSGIVGAEHNVVNASDHEVVFIETELLRDK